LDFKKYRLNPRVTLDLKKRSTIGIGFYFIVMWIILFSHRYYERHPEFSGIFLFFVIGICLLRLLHIAVYQRIPPKFRKLNTVLFLLSIALTALIWGVGCASFMIQDGESDTKMLVVICTMGLCSGGAVAYIPELRLSILFSFLMLAIPISAMVFHHADTPLALSMSIYLIYLCLMAYRGNREYWDALENEYLLEEKSKDVEKISRVDGLTGLYNRRYFDEVFAFEWSRSMRNQTPISLIICDIDHFKRVNDQYGHLAGDEYLKAMAIIIRRLFKRKIDITARFGGEEFIILLGDESSQNVCKLAETLRVMVQGFCLEYEGKSIRTTISLGTATHIPQHTDRQGILISRADKALYQSKSSGRNRTTQHD